MGPHSIVYRANLAALNVVLKISTNDQSFEDLTREANVYQGPLAPIQGSLIPRFHGYYKNERQGCLILEDCGKPAAYLSFSELSREERKKILHVLTEFHRLTGLHPDDFAEWNVVCMDGKYKLIDFHELIEHECHPGLVAQMRWPTDMVCTHLSVAVINMDLLPDDIKYPLVTIGNVPYLARNYPPKHIIDALLPNWYDPNLWLSTNKVLEWLGNVQKDYRNGRVGYRTEEGRKQIKMSTPTLGPNDLLF